MNEFDSETTRRHAAELARERLLAKSNQTHPTVSPYKAFIGVPPEYDAVIEKLSQQTGLSESEVVRRALRLMETAVDARLQGQRIGILNQAGNPITEVTGFNI